MTDLDGEIIRFLVPLPRPLPPLDLEIRHARASLGFEDVHADSVSLLDLCHEVVCLGKVMERVDEDEGWAVSGRRCDFGQHVDGDEACETECGGLV